MATPGARATGVGVLDKAVSVLDAVETRPMSTSELARALAMTMSTTHRLTGSLQAHELLRRDADGRFHLGPRFATAPLLETAGPALEALRDDTGESVQLWVRRGTQRMCAVSVESREELRTALPVGSFLDLPDGSAGQVLVGAPIPPGQGWLESSGTRTPGIASVSAPVYHHGEIVAALCLSGPLQRLAPSPGALHGSRVRDAARHVEAATWGSAAAD
jgi:DNA-binding IclR family transcriptional regulator